MAGGCMAPTIGLSAYSRTAIIIDTRIETNETRIGIESRNKIGVVVDSDRPVDVKDERSHARVIIVERTPPGVTGESKIQLRHSQRIMLPMVLYWAFTEHKTRSSTVEHAVVYLSSNHSAAGYDCVAFGRIKSLEGLVIEELNNSKLTVKWLAIMHY
ncbi:hypothetical protein EVAR_19054_1 [Eumeta japonica]|uniref:Uncharacterized protein n=1 Tax=Eumeta variegata TaxID=151549 RepID=A0A4C2A6W9_EUMVA|nr:hypothetical protein EVAR_19054_1 [Eumeta japonica]